MITEKPEGKKTASKIFTQDKEAIKIFHRANNFQPVFFQIKSLLEKGKVQTLLSLSIAMAEDSATAQLSHWRRCSGM